MPVLMNIKEDHPYFALAQVFEAAFDQASAGKGNERHAYHSSEKYTDQLICEMDRRLHGNADGPRYQAVKKIYESARMEPDRAVRELLGAINYTAAAIILLKEKTQHRSPSPEDIQKQQLYAKFLEMQNSVKDLTGSGGGKTEGSSGFDEIFDDNSGNVDQMRGGLGLS